MKILNETLMGNALVLQGLVRTVDISILGGSPLSEVPLYMYMIIEFAILIFMLFNLYVMIILPLYAFSFCRPFKVAGVIIGH